MVGPCDLGAPHLELIEKIRKLRAEVRKLEAEGKHELEATFERMTKETLDKAIETRVKELHRIGAAGGPEARVEHGS